MSKIIISIDGPSGSGKERISKYIAKKYKLYHLDSGILYRRFSYIIIKKEIKINNRDLGDFIKSKPYISHRNHSSLRKEYISNKTSKISSFPIVRKYINDIQKKTVEKILKIHKGCVIDGRDIGSKVFKNAKIKLFIQANPKIRAKRRHKQLIARGEKSIYSRILKDINLRDKKDKNRLASPLVVPKSAIIIDNSFSFKNTKFQINRALKDI